MKIYLYIKTHNITKLKYFGKTNKDPFKYRGSGTYWKKHIKKHGYDVTTEIIGCYTDKTECSTFALKFSKENDIVKSPEWANLIEENGLDGAPLNHPGHKFTKNELEKMSISSKNRWANEDYKSNMIKKHKDRWTDDMRNKQSQRLKGIKRPDHAHKMSGRKLSDQQKQNMRKPKHSGHGENVSKALKGKPKSEKHKRQLSISKQKHKGMLTDHLGCTYLVHKEFLCKYNLDPSFLDNFDVKIRYRKVYQKLNIDYDTNKHKTKRELGFKFN